MGRGGAKPQANSSYYLEALGEHFYWYLFHILFNVQLIMHLYNKVKFQQSFGYMEGLDPDFTRRLPQAAWHT